MHNTSKNTHKSKNKIDFKKKNILNKFKTKKMPSPDANKGLHQMEKVIGELDQKFKRGLVSSEAGIDLKATIARIRATKKRFRKLVVPPEADPELYKRISAALDRLLTDIKNSSKMDHPEADADPGERGFVMFNEIMNRMGAVY
jgi:hypothetical protein